MQQSLRKGDEGVGTRRRLLEALKMYGPKTARELAGLLGGGPVAMRVHLRNLYAAGLVTHVEEHQRVGRPVRRFHLTADADGLFAKHYDVLALKLFEALAADFGQAAVERVLTRLEGEILESLEQRLTKDAAQRPTALADYLADLGFMASVEESGGNVALVERNCPIAMVSARFPMLCGREALLFGRALGQEVSLVSCQSRGDETCVFALKGQARLPLTAHA